MASSSDKLATHPGLGRDGLAAVTEPGPGSMRPQLTPVPGEAANQTEPGLGEPPVSSRSRVPAARDVSTDSLLTGLGATHQAPESNGRMGVAFAAGPRAVPQAHTNRNDEPAVVLRQSLVDQAELTNQPIVAQRQGRGLGLEVAGVEAPGAPRRNLTPITLPNRPEDPARSAHLNGTTESMLRYSSKSSSTVIRDVPKRDAGWGPWLWLGALVLLVLLGLSTVYVMRPDLLKPAPRRSVQVQPAVTTVINVTPTVQPNFVPMQPGAVPPAVSLVRPKTAPPMQGKSQPGKPSVISPVNSTFNDLRPWTPPESH